MYFPTDSTAHTTAFGGTVVDCWLERKIVQTANASAMQDQSAVYDPNLYSRVLYLLSYVPPLTDGATAFEQCIGILQVFSAVKIVEIFHSC